MPFENMRNEEPTPEAKALGLGQDALRTDFHGHLELQDPQGRPRYMIYPETHDIGRETWENFRDNFKTKRVVDLLKEIHTE